MKVSKAIKVKNFTAFLLFFLLVISCTYLLVYKASFLPSGFDLVSKQKDSVSIMSYNLFGVEEGVSTISFSKKEEWKINEIGNEVKRQKEFLWLLFSMFSISIYLIIYKLRKGMKFWRAILESNIVFTVLIPLYIIINSLNRIQFLIH